MELTVIENVQKYVWNFDEVKAALSKHLEESRGLVVNDENLKSMEKTQKEIAGLRLKLDKFRKAAKVEIEKPYKTVESQVRELIALVEQVEKPIKEQLEKYELKRREEKRQEVQGIINTVANELALEGKYAAQLTVSDVYLNRTQTKKATIDDIKQRAAFLRQSQDNEKAAEEAQRNRDMLGEALCEKYSVGLVDPIEYITIVQWYSHVPTDQMEATIKGLAEKQAETEQRIRENAEQKAKEEAERIARIEAHRVAQEEAAEQEAIRKAEAVARAEVNRVAVESAQQIAATTEPAEPPAPPEPAPVKPKYDPNTICPDYQLLFSGDTLGKAYALKEFLDTNHYKYKAVK